MRIVPSNRIDSWNLDHPIPEMITTAVILGGAVPVYCSPGIAQSVRQLLESSPADFPVKFLIRETAALRSVPRRAIVFYDSSRGETRPELRTHPVLIDLAGTAAFDDLIRNALSSWTDTDVDKYDIRRLQDGRTAIFV